MASLEGLDDFVEQPLLTMREATKVLRIGRSLGYAMAHEYLNSGGTSGPKLLEERAFEPARSILRRVRIDHANLDACLGLGDSDRLGEI